MSDDNFDMETASCLCNKCEEGAFFIQNQLITCDGVVRDRVVAICTNCGVSASLRDWETEVKLKVVK